MSKINPERLQTKYSYTILVGKYLLQYQDEYFTVWKKEPGKPPKSKSSTLKKEIYGRGLHVNTLHSNPYQYQIACTNQVRSLVKVIDIEKDSIEMTFNCNLSHIASFYGECIQKFDVMTLTQGILLL
jgi:hypothetical protein